jgi:CRISPR-associated protein Csa5
MMSPPYRSVPELLAVLIAENESYTYVDKLGYAPSKDLALYYLREALRDFHSISKKPESQWSSEKAKNKAKEIDMERAITELEKIKKVSSIKDLREEISFITAKALALAATLAKTETSSGKQAGG